MDSTGLEIPASLSTVLIEADDGRTTLTVFRPWSLPGQISEWPRLGEFNPQGEPLGIRTVVPLDTTPVWLAARFAQAAILGAAKPRSDGGVIGLPMSTNEHPLSTNDINLVLGSLIDDEVLCFDADRGEFLVSPIDSRIVLTAEYSADHPGWGNVLTITAVCPQPGDAKKVAGTQEVVESRLQIGDWHLDDGRRKYRVCLPPQAFITPQLDVRRYFFKHAVRSVAEQAKRLWVSGMAE